MEAQPFIPDDDYCTYCHAVAAGPCAECGALCCGDCVEIVLRLTTQRAVCKQCTGAEPTPTSKRVWLWIGAGAAMVGAAWLLLYQLV